MVSEIHKTSKHTKMDVEQQNVDGSQEKDKETAVSYDDALAQAGN